MWFGNEVAHCGRVPVIATRHPRAIVQALLHDGPFTSIGDDEAVQIDLKTVGDRVVIDSRCQSTRSHQRVRIEPATLRDSAQLTRRVSGKTSAAATDVKPEFAGARRQTTLQRAHHRSRNA